MDYNRLFSHRGQKIEGSAIRSILKVTQQPGIISFAGGLPNDQLIPVDLINRLCQQILSSMPYTALQYSLTEGLPHVRLYLSNFINERCQTSYSADETLMVTGSQQAIDLATDLLINPGDKVLIERPCYLAALQIFRKLEARLVEVECDQDGMIVSQLEKKLKRGKFKLIYTNPDHQNPAGFELPLERRQAIFALAKKYQAIIFEDGAYREIRFSATPLPPIASFDRKKEIVLLSQSASKILSPGLRVGCLNGPKRLIEKIALLKQSVDVHTPCLNQEIFCRYLKEGHFKKHLPLIRGFYKKQAKAMNENLKKYAHIFDWQMPQGGLFIFLKVKKDIDTQRELSEIVRKYKVAYVPGAPFYAHKPQLNTLRLNFSKATAEQINIGIKKLSAAFTFTPPG